MPSPSELKEHGLALYRAERYADAAEKFAEAARACEAAGDRGAAAEMRNNQCVAHMAVSQWDAALAAVEGTPEMFRALGDRMREAQAVANLAAAHDGAGHVEQAELPGRRLICRRAQRRIARASKSERAPNQQTRQLQALAFHALRAEPSSELCQRRRSRPCSTER
jgi:tetratricopeptide (TPR) repeat protein